MAELIRTELARPGIQFLSRSVYAQLFTIHGTTMIFLFIAPMGLGLANYFVPLQVGAPDMAFPRMNALSYWLFLGGGLTILSSFGASHGAAAFGWTGYAPLSGAEGSPGPGADMWIMGILLTSASSILTGVNLLATVFMLRAPGMTMFRLSLFTWNMVVTSLLILVAFPPLAAALSMVVIDRHQILQLDRHDVGRAPHVRDADALEPGIPGEFPDRRHHGRDARGAAGRLPDAGHLLRRGAYALRARRRLAVRDLRRHLLLVP